MKKLVLIFSALVIILASCKKKEYPQSVSESPAFYVSAKVNGEPLMLQAGTLGYYMYSSYTQDVDGMYSFIADVKPSNCGNSCNNSLKIEFNDNIQTLQGNNSNIASSIKVGAYEYVNTSTVNPTLVGYMVMYKSSFNLYPSSYYWSYGVGSPDTIANPTHTYAAAGSYNTRLTASGTNSPPSSAFIDNPVKVTLNTNVCRTRIAVTGSTNNVVQFTNITSGSGPQNYVYHWEFGDGSPSSPDATPTHTFPGNGVYQVTLTTIDNGNQGDVDEYHYNVNIGLPNTATPNFYVNSVTGIYSNSPLAKIKITYTDASGITFSSSRNPQTGPNNSFHIDSIEEYKVNELNQKTKKLKIKFSCRLYSGASFVDITDGEAVIAVAYK